MSLSAARTPTRVFSASMIALALGVTMPARHCMAQALAASDPGPAHASAAESALVVPGARHRADGIHRWLLGKHYRDTWATPVRAPVLDLATFAGGLRVVGVGGGMETYTLKLRGRDGREYRFRSVDKDPIRQIPPDLKSPDVEYIYEDDVSSEYPGAPAMVPPLLTATGVLHVEPQLFVMPDDPALAAYRAQFRGVLGFLEEHPATDENGSLFKGATRIVDTETLLEEIDRSPANRLDARAYLAARFMDIYVGDWDRGDRQWSWARYGEKGAHVWRPIPRDRDRAFAMNDGVGEWVARLWEPQLITFRDKYPDMLGLVHRSWTQDRRLLQELDRSVWDSTATALQRALTDSVIDEAIMRLPASQRARDGASFAQKLRRRRDRLPAAARQFYAVVARDADVRASAEPSFVEISREPHGAVDVRLSVRDGRTVGAEPVPYYHRRFARSETEEIRLYLGDGPDSVIVHGVGRDDIKVRIITGARGAVVIDSARMTSRMGGTLVYDSSGRSQVSPSHGVPVDRRAYAPPAPTRLDSLRRDEGDSLRGLPWVDYGADLGLFAGATVTFQRRGFRQVPFAQRHTLRAGYATSAKGYRAEYEGRFRGTGNSTILAVRAAASELDLLRFYGIGNETPTTGPNAFYRIRDGEYRDYIAAVGIEAPVANRASVSFGPFVRYSRTASGSATLLEQTRPYGSGSFGVVGAQVDALLDTRDRGEADSRWGNTRVPSGQDNRRGLLLELGGSASPAWWDVRSAYGELHGEARTYLTAATLPTRPTLALRVGGRKGWGDTPFQDLAYLGGSGKPLRGFDNDRFAGTSMVYGNAELRSRLRDVNVLLPAKLGAFVLADVGRVYAPGESSTLWHKAFGGGLSLAFLHGRHVVSGAAAHSTEGTRFYLRSGFAY